jgi:hypothetical protein
LSITFSPLSAKSPSRLKSMKPSNLEPGDPVTWMIAS